MAELQKAVENCGSAGELLLARASMSEVALAVRDLVRSLEENFIRKHSEEDDEKAVDILVELAGLCEKFGLVHEPVDFMSNSSTDSCISAVEEAQDAIIRMLNSLDDRITGAVDNYGELQTEKLIAVSIDLFLVVGTAYCSQKTVQFLYEILASASNGKKSPKIGFIMMECILKFLKKSEAIAVKNFFLFNGRESQIAFNLPKISFHEGYTISFKIYLEKSESSEFSILSLKSESGLGLDLVLRRIPHKFDSHQLLLLINSTMQINFDSSEFFSEQWYFISLKQEYSHSGNRRFPVELYVNGHLKSSMNVMTYPNIRDTVLSGSMGSSFSQETQSIPSRIAEISFYSIALTSKEIQFLHNNYSLNRTAESGSEIRHNGISLHTINQTLTSFLHSIGMMDQHSEKDDIDFKIFSFSPSFIISNVCSDPRTTFLMQEPRVFYPHGVLNRFVKIRIFWKLDEQIQSFAEGISTFLPVCLKCDHFLLNDKSSFLINYIEILGSLIKSNKKIQSDFILKKEFKFLAYILSSIDGETLSYAFIESLERFVITCAWISAEQCIDSSKYPILTREIAKKRSLINDCIELILLNPLIWMRKDVDPKIRSNFLSILEDFVCSQAVNQFSYLKNNPQFSFDSLWLMLSNFLSYNDNNQVANSEETFQLRKRIIILYELTSEFRLSSEEIQSISFLAFNSKLVLETVEILSLLRKVLLNNRTGALNSLHRIGSPLIFISDSLWSRNEAIVLATLHFLGAEFQDSTAHSDKVEAVFSLIFQSLSSPASCGLTVLIYQAILEIVLNLSPGTIGISDPTEAVFQKLSAHPSSRELLREIPSTTVVRFLPVFGQMYQAIKILREKNGILFSKLIEFLVSDLRQILSNPNNIASSLLNIAFMQFLRDLIIDLYEKRGTSFDELYNRVFSESGVERSDINPFFSGFSSISSDDMSSRYMQLLDIISSMFTFALTYLENGWEFYLQFLCQLNNELDPCTSNATNTRLSLQADILFLIAIRLDLQKNRKICGKNLQILIIFLNPQFMFPSTGSTSYRRQSRDWISVWVEDPLTSSIISDNGRKCASLYSFMHLLVSNDIPLLLLDPPIISDNFLTLLKISRQDFRIFFNSEAPLRSLCGIIYTNLEMALEKLDSSLYERMLSHLFKALSIFSKEQDIAFRKSKNLHGVLSREVILILRKVMFIWEDRQSCTQLEMMSSKELDNFVGCFTAISQWVSSIEDKFCPFAPVKSSELQLDENRLSQLHHFLQKRQFKGIDRLLISSSVKKFLYPSSKQIQIPISLDLIQEKDFIIDPEFLQHVLMRYGWGFLEQKIKSQLQFVVSSYLKKVRDDEEGIVSKFSVLSSDLIQGISRTLSDSTRRIQSISESLYEKRLKYFQEQIFCERNHHLKFEKFRLEYAQRILESVLKLHDLINSSISPWRDSGIVSPHPLWKLNTFQDQQQRRPLLEQVFDLYDNSQEMIPSHSDYLKNEDNFDPVVSQIPIKTDDIVKEFLSTNDESSLHLKISANEDGEQDLIDDDLSGSGWEVLNMEFDQENMNGVRKSNGFFSVECSMILPFDCVKGSLHINHEEMVFTPNLEETLKYCPTNLVHVIDDVFSNNSDHQVGRFLNRNLELLRKRCRVSHSLSLKHLKYVYNRRYLLKRTALEVFNLDGKSFLYDFTTEDIQKEVIRFIRSLKPPNLDYLSMSRAEKLLRSSNMTERWQRREISNFEYLMYLNSVSGRSYNDINQYPIFPWIISDYTSSEIDLSNISTFRDLTKPIGALSDERFKKLEERFESLSESDIPPFFYGSHYSNAATVIYYLIRIEPFASLHVELQSGRFDFADRLFHSIPQLWETCLSSMSCFKELIPEFFYLPEFLENVNNFDLGVKQDGKRVTDVELPPWAANSEEFVMINRAALESDYVDKNLHHWIDLIFGCKQRGSRAFAAKNIFYYLTYEGAVDFDKIEDPILKKSIMDQISQFGQTPLMLFEDSHPKREPRKPKIEQNIHRSMTECCSKITEYVCNYPESQVLSCSIEANAGIYVMLGHPWKFRICFYSFESKPKDSRFQTISVDLSLLSLNLECEPNLKGVSKEYSLGMHLFRLSDVNQINESYFRTELSRTRVSFVLERLTDKSGNVGLYLIMGNQIESSLRVFLVEKEMAGTVAGTFPGNFSDHSEFLLNEIKVIFVQSINAHILPISSMKMDSKGFYFATGSEDCTIALWNTFNSLNNHQESLTNRRSCFQMHPAKFLHGHPSAIREISLDSSLNTCVSLSDGGGILVHDISRGHLRTRISLDRFTPDSLSLCSNGQITCYSMQTQSFLFTSVNGRTTRIQSIEEEIPSSRKLTCFTFSRSGNFCAFGFDDGFVQITPTGFSLTKRPGELFSALSCSICSLGFSPEESLLFVSGTSGFLLLDLSTLLT